MKKAFHLKSNSDKSKSVTDKLSKSVEKHTTAPLFSNVQTRKEVNYETQ